MKTKFKQKEQKRREEKVQYAEEQAARAELLLTEEAGYLEGDETEEFTGRIKQTQIRKVWLNLSRSGHLRLAVIFSFSNIGFGLEVRDYLRLPIYQSPKL